MAGRRARRTLRRALLDGGWARGNRTSSHESLSRAWFRRRPGVPRGFRHRLQAGRGGALRAEQRLRRRADLRWERRAVRRSCRAESVSRSRRRAASGTRRRRPVAAVAAAGTGGSGGGGTAGRRRGRWRRRGGGGGAAAAAAPAAAVAAAAAAPAAPVAAAAPAAAARRRRRRDRWRRRDWRRRHGGGWRQAVGDAGRRVTRHRLDRLRQSCASKRTSAISYSRVPLPVLSVTASPRSRPIMARASGAEIAMRLALMSASWSPTIV